MNQVFINKKFKNYVLIFMCKNTFRKKCKKNLGKTYYLILFYLNSFLELDIIMHDYVSCGTEPESELQIKT